ncbi:MAG: TolC family protein [Deltaproteobacteria bacterium]|nr:TolC family protein [Deltaproteobacteria bacterium]
MAILVVIFWLGLPGLPPAASQPLTLGEAMFLALKHNPGLKAAGMTVETAEADLAKARARFLPKVNFGETYNFSDNPTQVFMNKLNQRVFTQQDFLLDNLNFPKPFGNFRTGLTMSQPLFQAGEAYLGYKQAQLGREMAGAIVLSARQQLLFQVTQAYYGLQLAQENLAVVKKARATAAEHVKIAQSRFRSGAVVQADVLSAQVHLAKITQEQMTAASQVEIAQSALGTVLGVPEAGSRPLAAAPREPAALPKELADLQRIAQEKRPDLKRLTLAARSAQEEVTKARLNYLPRLNVVAEYDVDQRRLFGTNADSYTVMALLNFNLFNGLADLARVRESRAKEAQARDLKQEMEDRVRHQVTETILNLKTARKRLQVAKDAVAQARESLRLIRLRYETGLTILVDLLTAEDALKNAELSQVGALLDTHLAQAGLELALGTISGPAETGSNALGAGVKPASAKNN